jgi:ABC-2 type transport system ATP-binding protein
MRAGRIIADTTPDGLFADTGTTDAAFLTLIERDAQPRAEAGAQHPLTRREAREQAEHAGHPHHGSAS